MMSFSRISRRCPKTRSGYFSRSRTSSGMVAHQQARAPSRLDELTEVRQVHVGQHEARADALVQRRRRGARGSSPSSAPRGRRCATRCCGRAAPGCPPGCSRRRRSGAAGRCSPRGRCAAGSSRGSAGPSAARRSRSTAPSPSAPRRDRGCARRRSRAPAGRGPGGRAPGTARRCAAPPTERPLSRRMISSATSSTERRHQWSVSSTPGPPRSTAESVSLGRCSRRWRSMSMGRTGSGEAR